VIIHIESASTFVMSAPLVPFPASDANRIEEKASASYSHDQRQVKSFSHEDATSFLRWK
jgi:hypothetical protein